MVEMHICGPPTAFRLNELPLCLFLFSFYWFIRFGFHSNTCGTLGCITLLWLLRQMQFIERRGEASKPYSTFLNLNTETTQNVVQVLEYF